MTEITIIDLIKETPYYTYIDLLVEALNTYKPKRIIEWGTGVSTKIMDREGVDEVHTIEHDLEWYNKFKDGYSNRVKCYHMISPDYIVAGNLFQENYFDMAFIDGAEPRVEYMKTAKGLVRNGGLILLHDAETPHYEEGIKLFVPIKEVELVFSSYHLKTLLMVNNK
ncbi:class I SAM-dependent methyltransferase [candidate division WOR-3 bacterium]|nr:class I SAM-dependent methyltransferase [candidate division WOR-3 bacterium]